MSKTLCLLVTERFVEADGVALRDTAEAAGIALDLVVLPKDPSVRLEPAVLERVEAAFFSGDLPAVQDDGLTMRSFWAAAQGAANLQWMHVFNAGVDHPIFARFLDRGVRLTTSSGAAAEPIALSAVAGMLALARELPKRWDAQRRKAWEPLRGVPPADLRGQTIVVVGVGAIGREVARLAQAIGMHVIGVRRSPAQPGEPVDEMRPPSELKDVLLRADWLALACPLTDETRGIISAEAIALMPAGARVLNVARGEVIDEDALIAALQEGRLGGAYLDVFRQEPLPVESPLWEMANVIVSPHDSAASQGNAGRVREIFFRNLGKYARGEELENEVS